MSAEAKPVALSSVNRDGKHLTTEAEEFQAGAIEGWNRAWTEYYASVVGSSTNLPHFQHSLSPAEELPHPDEHCVEASRSEELVQFELSSEWATFFARGEARRRELLEESTRQARIEEDIERAKEEAELPLYLGGARDSAARDRARKLYADRADEVLLAEARLDAAFQTFNASNRAPLWPVLPLTSWKPAKP